MRHSLQPPSAPGRVFGAWVCLVAALLLWAPIWAAAWQANSMACCDGTQCPVHRHGAAKHKSVSPSPAEESPMACHHGGGAGLMACAMSCCHDQEHALTGAVVFVLPQVTELASPVETLASVTFAQPQEIFSQFGPPSPPPKYSLTSL